MEQTAPIGEIRSFGDWSLWDTIIFPTLVRGM